MRLPTPPSAAWKLRDEARRNGYSLRCHMESHYAQEEGGRYRISRKGSEWPLFVTDDIDAARAWLWTQG